MKFNDITSALLSKDNCSMLIKTEHGTEYVENLHSFVNVDKLIISKLDFSKDRKRAEELKAKLEYILNNYSSIERHSIGWKPTKKKR